MFNTIQKFIYFFLALQEKALKKRLGRKFKRSYSNSTSKVVYGKNCSLNLTVKTEQNKAKLKNDVEVILKKYGNNPEKLLKFIEKSGTCVYKIPYANKILKLIGLEEGLIGKISGLKALLLTACLSIMTKQALISTKTKPMFVLSDSTLNSYQVIQQFHKWYAMKLKLPGYDAESQANFQKFMTSSKDEEIKDLSIEEILGLKEAIARDVEAINFVVSLAKGTDGSRSAMQKLTTGGASV